MTREGAKQLLPILQAFVEDKIIQYRDNEVWKDITMEEGLYIENAFVNYNDYRIKPTPTYRPFANADECWNEMLKHKPFGWVKGKGDLNGIYSILGITENEVVLVDDRDRYCVIYDNYTFANGTPFGVKIEEE